MENKIESPVNRVVWGNGKKKYWIGGYALIAFVFLALHFAIEIDIFPDYISRNPLIQKLSLSAFFIFLVLMAGKIIEKLIETKSESEGNKYNLIRITRLLTTVFILILFISFLAQNLYAAAVSFGLISLVLGFALQAPISSFIAWLYIVFRKPYQVGDRIQIGNFKGDVMEIGYLDTVLLEFHGEYLKNDRNSGRVITFPNSLILRSEIFNYSGPYSPFIWNETAVQVAYSSDVEFVEECLLEAALQDFQKKYPQYDLKRYPYWKPVVYFRVNKYSWLEAVVSYPVDPLETTPRRTRILKSALETLNRNPQRVQFPEGNRR